MLEGSREDDRGAGTGGEDGGEDSASPGRDNSILDIHVRFKKCPAATTICIFLALLM